MSNIRIDKQKALKKWAPVLENMGVTNEDRLDWMSEYAEYHSINENAYVNAANAGMGAVSSPQPSVFAGSNAYTGNSLASGSGLSNLGNLGSGDLGQNLLPVAMKIAAQTIGLDLVSVKPSPGPKLDLLYIDFQYDDVDTNQGRPLVFKVDSGVTATNSAVSSAIRSTSGYSTYINESVGGLQTVFTGAGNGGAYHVYVSLNAAGAGHLGTTVSVTPTVWTGVKTGVGEFLGFSRIDGFPIFRGWRQANATGNYLTTTSAPYTFGTTSNTFQETGSINQQITAVAGVAGAYSVSLVSALEDHLPQFSTNFSANSANGKYPMSRDEDDTTYAGAIGPKISSKSIAVGTIEVSSVLRRTEIEDIKANTGMDIVQKMESILVNELSQTISKQIVGKVFEMGDLNRASAPAGGTGSITYQGVAQTVFDLDTIYAVAGPGGETTHAVQRKLITKMVHASNYIATEGRVGPAQYAVTNGALAASLMDIAGYTINPVKSKINGSGQLYPVGQIGDIQIYVDPYMKYNDNRIVLGRKNNPDQPGIIFVPYLMAQSITLMSEATFAPRMLLRSRYAVAEVGWFPQKQYMTIIVKDANGFLN